LQFLQRDPSARRSISTSAGAHRLQPKGLMMMMQALNPPPRVLLAEDDDDIRWGLAELLMKRRCVVFEAKNGTQLLDYLASSMLLSKMRPIPDVIVSDIRMPGFNGLSILEGLRGAGWMTSFILLTAFGDTATRERALAMGATAFFDKPIDLDRLEEEVIRAARIERTKPSHERRAVPSVLESAPLSTATRALEAEGIESLMVVRSGSSGYELSGVLSAKRLAGTPPGEHAIVRNLSRSWKDEPAGGAAGVLIARLARREIERLPILVHGDPDRPLRIAYLDRLAD
jgi:CheY-like chemotaxis protein